MLSLIEDGGCDWQEFKLKPLENHGGLVWCVNKFAYYRGAYRQSTRVLNNQDILNLCFRK